MTLGHGSASGGTQVIPVKRWHGEIWSFPVRHTMGDGVFLVSVSSPGVRCYSEAMVLGKGEEEA